jgi:hypothetical protein
MRPVNPIRRLVGAFLIFVAAAVLAAVPALAAGQAPNPNTLLPNAAGLTIKHYSSAATTNSTLVSAGIHALYGINLNNTSGSIIYVKLYNKATAPTCGTDVPVMTIPVGATTGSIQKGFMIPVQFPLGIGLCATGAIADADTTATGTGATFDLAYK